MTKNNKGAPSSLQAKNIFEKQSTSNEFQSFIQKYYIVEFQFHQNLFKRNKFVSYALILLQQVLWIQFAFNDEVASSIEQQMSFMQNVKYIWILRNLSTQLDITHNIQYFLLGINLFILFMLAIQIIAYNSQNKNQESNTINYGENSNANGEVEDDDGLILKIIMERWINYPLSIVFKVYHFSFFPFSIYVSVQDFSIVSAINIVLTAALGLIIQDGEYDYLLDSQDFLRMKSQTISYFYLMIDMTLIIAISMVSPKSAIIIYLLHIGLHIGFIMIYKPYFEMAIFQFDLYLSTYFLIAQLGSIAFVFNQPNNMLNFLALYYLIAIPLSYQIFSILYAYLQQNMKLMFEKKIIFSKIDTSGAESLDYFMRNVFSEVQNNGRYLTESQLELQRIAQVNCIMELSQILYQQCSEEEKEKIETHMNQRNYNELIQKGEEYIGKKDLLEERQRIFECLNQLLQIIYVKGKKNSKLNFSNWDISHLVFLLSLKQNYQLFEMTAILNSKSISKKQLQILFSLRRQLKEKVGLQKYLCNDSIFENILIQIINYDEIIDDTRQLINEATEMKIEILVIMKQKYIELLEIQNKLKQLLQLRKQLISSITRLVQINSLNNELYDIYYTYLEILAFSEKDLKLKKFRIYQNVDNISLRNFMHQSNNEDACVIFARFKNESSQIIQTVSHNFPKIFGMNPADFIQKPITNLMTDPYAKNHSKYMKNFLERNKIKTNIKYQTLFAKVHNEYILPIQLDFKINFAVNQKYESEFGIAAYIQLIQKDKLYILYDSKTSRVVSMTPQTHIELFSAIENYNKINLISFFPLLQKTIGKQQSNRQLKKKNNQNNSLISFKTSMMSLNATQTMENNNNNNEYDDQQPNNAAILASLRTIKLNQRFLKNEQIEEKDIEDVNYSFQQFQQQISFKENNIEQIQSIVNQQEQNILELDKVDMQNAGIDAQNYHEFNNNNNNNNIKYYDSEIILSAKQILKNDESEKNPQQLKEKKSQYSQMIEKKSNTVLSQTTLTKNEEIFDVQYLFLSPSENIFYNKKKQEEKGKKPKKKKLSNNRIDCNYQNINKYNFFTMNLTVFTVQSEDLNHLKYIEITNVKKINPVFNASFILSVYNNPSQMGFSSNITHIKKASLRIIIGELEQIQKQFVQTSHYASFENNDMNHNSLNQFNEEDEDEEDDQEQMIGMYGEEIQNNSNKKQQAKLQSYEDKNQKLKNASQISDNIIPQPQAIFNNSSQIQDLSKDNSRMNLINHKNNKPIALYDLNNSQLVHKDSGLEVGQNIQNNSQKMENSNDIFEKIPKKQPIVNNNSNIFQGINNQTIIEDEQTYNQRRDKNFSQNMTNNNSTTIQSKSYQSQLQNSSKITQKNNNLVKNKEAHDIMIDSVNEIQPQAPRGSYLNNQNEFVKQEYQNQKEQTNRGKKQMSTIATQQIMSPNNKSFQGDLMSPLGTNHQMLSVKGNQATQNLLSPLNNSSQRQALKGMFKSTRTTVTKKSNLNKQGTQTNVMSATMKQTQAFVNQQSKKVHKNVQDAIDQSSNHSKNSSATSNRKTVRNLILSTKKLGIMNFVNIFGLLSFVVIIIVVIQQYFDMISQFDDFQGDMGVVGWPTDYMNTLSLIVKNVNLQKLLKANDLYLKSGPVIQQQMITECQNEIGASINQMEVLVNTMELAPDSRQIFGKIRDAPEIFWFGSNYNVQIPLNQQASDTYFQIIPREMGLFESLLMLIAYVFRFGNGLGLGSGQFITLNNQVPVENSLKSISQISLLEMDTQLDSIYNNLQNVLIILLVVIFCCVFISIPIYILIQNKKQQLLQLFGTFNQSSIQKEMNSICEVFFNFNNGLFHNSAIKLAQKSQAGSENEKRQNMSSNSQLQKFNFKILILSVFLFVITLPYPIINQVLASNFIIESKKTLSMLGKQMSYCFKFQYSFILISTYFFNSYIIYLNYQQRYNILNGINGY